MPPEATTDPASSSNEVRFASELYLPEAVNASVEAFSSLATLTVETAADGKQIVVRYQDVREDVADAFRDEFCNHALASTIELRRVAEI